MSGGVISPWKRNPAETSASSTSFASNDFRTIMDETLAVQLTEEFDAAYPTRNVQSVACEATGSDAAAVENVSDENVDDQTMALLLQAEFDKEYDEILNKTELNANKNQKVGVSYRKYRSSGGEFDLADSSDDSTDDDTRELRQLKTYSAKLPTFGKSGLIKDDRGNIITKHDKVICGRRNTSRVMQFPPGFSTGDPLQMDVQMPNHVFNKLKQHSQNTEKRRHRLHDKKDISTANLAVDSRTRLLLFKWVDAGMLESISGIVSTGKEAVVLHCYGGSHEDYAIPSECAIKVFKTTLNEFKNRKEYVNDDYRFKNPRTVLKVWAEKEELNLKRLFKSNIPCPRVVKLKQHVLLMSFIGSDGLSAPQLKSANLDDADLIIAFDQCKQLLYRIYNGCKLVHGDFSEFNILWWNNMCYVIDVGQAVDTSHPKALWYLARDCFNICSFFNKRGIPGVDDPRDVFNTVTGLEMETSAIEDAQEFLVEVSKFEDANPNLITIRDKKRPADCELRKAEQADYEEYI